jgi:hypothetical protein
MANKSFFWPQRREEKNSLGGFSPGITPTRKVLGFYLKHSLQFVKKENGDPGEKYSQNFQLYNSG